MKATTGWFSYNVGATNESGFTGLPGGNRYGDGAYFNIGYYGIWWSSTVGVSSNAWNRVLYYDDSNVASNPGLNMQLGFSVRCVRD